MKTSTFTSREANVLYVVIAFVLLTAGAYLQTRWLIPGLLITQYGVIFLPVLLLALVKRKNLTEALRLKRLPAKTVGKIVCLAIAFIPIVAVANLIVISLIDHFSNALDVPIPVADSGGRYVLYMFVISVTAGICEETFFRGLVLGGYESALNRKSAAIWSALFFGLFHFNPQNLIGPILLGLVFAYLVQVTGSIWAGVVGHMANNGVAVTVGFLGTIASRYSPPTGLESDLIAQPEILAPVVIFFAILAVVSAIAVKHLLASIRSDFPRFKEGDGIVVKGARYRVTAFDKETGKVELYATVDDDQKTMFTTVDKLKAVGVKTHYTLWQGEPFKAPLSTWATLAPILILYGMIIYQAYIRG